MLKRSKGFTMTEISLVVMMISTIAGLAAPRFRSTIDEANLTAGANQVKMAMNYTRQYAITARATAKVTVQVNRNRVRVKDLDAGTIVKDFNLPSGVAITERGGQRKFFPRGVSKSGYVIVENSAGRKQISVNLVGRVDVTDLAPSG
jgi:prepilin-type N-terminal cleavage/methylation domain-containing protein